VTAFARFPVIAVSVELAHAAIAARDRFVLSYWDAAIIEGGRMLGCDQVLSEDLNDGQDFDGIVVVNPFR
jgi:predicted nucleic acid-binding protein